MPYTMSIPNMPTPNTRIYAKLAGVDFASLPSKVDNTRSPDALNVYKDYTSTAGQAIQTRPGFVKRGSVDETIYGIHRLQDTVLIHHGTSLSLWANFPSSFTDENLTQLYSNMNQAYSTSFVFDGKLYILDGNNYLVYDSNSVNEVVGYVPTTRINSDPDGGNGEVYQSVNLLSSYRINTFVGDGESTVFYLDDIGIDNEQPVVKVYGVIAEVQSYSISEGTVTLSAAPSKPLTAGEANVEITYKKSISGNADKIKKCTLARVFDGRVFVSGNDDYKGYIHHSELENPAYYSDYSYYDDGNDGIAVKALASSSGNLVVIKDCNGMQNSKIFYHSPSIDYEYGKVYPCTQTEINLGTTSKAINYNDEICYLSPYGLKSVTFGTTNTSIYHKSSFVDRYLTNEPDIENADICLWRGYLCILINGKIYLADSRQIHKTFQHYEYEWYLWDNIRLDNENGFLLFVFDDTLYFATKYSIAEFTGTNDNGYAINSYWTTPQDVFSAPAYLKTTGKRGAMAWVKAIPNSIVKISSTTDKESNSLLHEQRTEGFSFNNLDFKNLIFSTGEKSQVFFKAKKKKILYFSLKFYSDEINKPFGLYEAVIEYTVTKYAKG